MIVESLSVRNWRGYRQLHRYDFGEGLNLIVGANEAGKSTLFEALARALFDRHTSRARELRQVQPLGSSLAPEIDLVFSSDGQRYRVRKRFLVEPTSELYSERKGSFELDHEGDLADQELRRILGGETTRGATRPEHRGLAQALWLLQRQDPVPERTWNDALERGLSGLLEIALRSEHEERVVAAIQDEYRRHWTAGGRISKRSELGRLEARLPELEEDLARCREEMVRAEDYRAQLRELEIQQGGIVEREQSEGRRLAPLEKAVERASELERRLERESSELEGLDESASRLSRSLHGVRKRQKRLGELEGARVEVGQREAQLSADVRQFRRTAEGHARRQEKELQPKLKEVEAKVEELQGRLRLDQLEREVSLLSRQLERRRQRLARRAELRARLEELAAPSDAELSELSGLQRRLEVAEARAETGAVRIAFELGELSVETDPEVARDAETGEYRVTRSTTFVLGDLGEVRVRGDDELERRSREVAELRGLLGERFEQHGGGLEELRTRVERRQELERKLVEVEERLVESDSEEVESRLAETEHELARLRQRTPQAVLPGIEGWALSRTHDELRDLEEERSRVQRLLAEERDAEQSAQHVCLEKSEELREVSQRSAGLRSELKGLREQIEEQLEAYGTVETLEREHRREKERAEEKRRGVESLRREYSEKVEKPRGELEALQARLESLAAERGRLAGEIADRLARIEEVAAHGLYSQTAELEGNVERLRERRGVLGRRAHGARLLESVVEDLRRRRTQSLSEPIVEIVDRWLQELTEGRYRGLDLDVDLLPVAVVSDRYGESLPLDSLSHGTHEQVAVLLRLAMGVLLSRQERQLVVIDDRLINADPVRSERLSRILEQAAEHCQILLATCRPDLYADLSVDRRLEIPGGGMEEAEHDPVAAGREAG